MTAYTKPLRGNRLSYDDIVIRSKHISGMQHHMIRLYNLTKHLPLPRTVVELGTRFGESTMAFVAAVSDVGGHVYSVDIHDQRDHRLFNAALLNHEGDNLTFIRGDSLLVVQLWELPIDHLFIDTTHQYAQSINELNQWGKYVKPGGIISLHDTSAGNPPEGITGPWQLNGFPGLRQAIREYMVAHPDYTITEHPECFGLSVIRK